MIEMFLSRVSELEAALARYPVKNEVKAGQHARTPAQGEPLLLLAQGLVQVVLDGIQEVGGVHKVLVQLHAGREGCGEGLGGSRGASALPVPAHAAPAGRPRGEEPPQRDVAPCPATATARPGRAVNRCPVSQEAGQPPVPVLWPPQRASLPSWHMLPAHPSAP